MKTRRGTQKVNGEERESKAVIMAKAGAKVDRVVSSRGGPES